MTDSTKNIVLDDKWLRASVLGSVWASFEIIAGSSLHNLRIPFAGTFLTLFAVILLISFSRVWPQKGVILRAGIICALMKSISPSAVIIGPMIGIITEALIIELLLQLTGRNLLSAGVAGALTVLSALLHKVVNLLILYGFDLVQVYSNLVIFAAKKLNLDQISPATVFKLFILMYLIIGAVGGIVGFYIGKKAASSAKITEVSLRTDNYHREHQENEKYSLPLLGFHLLFLILSLLLFEISSVLWFKTTLIWIYIFFTLIYYKRISGRLLKPVFWIQLLALLLLAGIFAETPNPGKIDWLMAFKYGWQFFIRALIVVTAFASISAELANPVIRDFLVKKGFSRLYISLQLSFQSLPALMENKNIRSLLKNPSRSFSRLVLDAESKLSEFQNQNHANS